jgi:hypothetical protein
MQCPTCAIETNSSRSVNVQPEEDENIYLVQHFECQRGHKWHFNVSTVKTEPCDCPENQQSS